MSRVRITHAGDGGTHFPLTRLVGARVHEGVKDMSKDRLGLLFVAEQRYERIVFANCSGISC
jgi:hypothetical protein